MASRPSDRPRSWAAPPPTPLAAGPRFSLRCDICVGACDACFLWGSRGADLFWFEVGGNAGFVAVVLLKFYLSVRSVQGAGLCDNVELWNCKPPACSGDCPPDPAALALVRCRLQPGGTACACESVSVRSCRRVTVIRVAWCGGTREATLGQASRASPDLQ